MSIHSIHIRIGVVDNQAGVRECVVNYLKDVPGFEIVFEAGNGKEAVQKAERYKPDVIITEIKMSRMRGDTATERIRKKIPKIKVLAYTLEVSRESIISLILKDCNGYVLKAEPMPELVRAITDVVNMDFYYNKQVKRGFRYKVLNGTIKAIKTPRADITPQEKRIMVLLCRQMKQHEIAKELHISPRTVHRHCENITHKTGLNVVGMAFYAYFKGWAPKPLIIC